MVADTWFWFLDDHSLNFLGDHSLFASEASGWHSDMSSFHGGHIIPVIKHIGNINCINFVNVCETICDLLTYANKTVATEKETDIY